MAVWMRQGGGWIPMVDSTLNNYPYAKIGGTWRLVTRTYVKVGGAWRQTFTV